MDVKTVNKKIDQAADKVKDLTAGVGEKLADAGEKGKELLHDAVSATESLGARAGHAVQKTAEKAAEGVEGIASRAGDIADDLAKKAAK